MTAFLLTFAIIVIALLFLSLSLLLTGKLNYRVGMCGRDPTRKREGSEGCDEAGSCQTCGKPPEEKLKK